MKLAIALCLYRRPLYTEQVLNALLECYGIDDIPVYLSQDWSSEMNHSSEEVARLANQFQKKHKGQSRYTVNNPALGVDLNKLSVIPKAFGDGADFLIFLEDDHVFSRDAIAWFIQMGERFKDDEGVGFITGYARQTGAEFRASSPETFGVSTEVGFDPHSWATWRDRWEYFFPDGGEHYKQTCGDQANGLFDHYCHLRTGQVLFKHRTPGVVGMNRPNYPGLVTPQIARTQLIGWEDATHTPSKEWFMENEFNEWGMWNLL